ncbi:OmpH family outer membrane protein [Polaribacter sp. Hel1_85]|uniref:OmpH family outer membrane protein n=1 Tax=Polaribacter sp. Hel1_85 TaxID=1250005 RepID=UPI00052C50F9|nr:OmpH family outer membrane protein [Polaribacter sp. Hel1_85]KGL61693.1 outer membrane protein H precursor [Polaribacter sp. Hel1_85]
MKNFKTLLLIAVFTLGVAGVANAQKVGHIDFEKLVAEMPQTKTLKLEMEKLGKTYQDEILGMEKKIEATRKKYVAESKTQTNETNDTRAQELQQEAAKMEQARRFAYQDMQKRQNDGLQPIIEKAQKAIEEVAAAKSILYILDASVGKGLLVKKGEDIYNAVKTKLGF